MSHTCSHNHSHAGPGTSSKKMGLGVLLTLALVFGELVAGTFSHSLALFSDAGHNFADAAALGFSWYALWIASKPSNAGMTFGYHRVAILAALGNAVFLVLIALGIGYEALLRLHHPEPVSSWLMSGTAAAAIAVNLLIGLWLHAGAKHDINLRGAYLHMMADAVSALGVVAAGIIIAITHSALADPVISIVIALLIVWSSWGILKESVQVLLEGTPLGLDMAAVLTTIRAIPGVCDVHDLHIWTVGPGAIACSCHIVVEEQSVRDGQQILRAVVETLRHDFAISHSTVQVEVEGCADAETFCTLTANPQHV